MASVHPRREEQKTAPVIWSTPSLDRLLQIYLQPTSTRVQVMKSMFFKINGRLNVVKTSWKENLVWNRRVSWLPGRQREINWAASAWLSARQV